jgi:archaeosine-15-forming tRNA-guanine transglycosylase
MQGYIPRSEFKDDFYRKFYLKVRELLSGSIKYLTYKKLYKYILDVDNKIRASRKLAIVKKEIRILLINQL